MTADHDERGVTAPGAIPTAEVTVNGLVKDDEDIGERGMITRFDELVKAGKVFYDYDFVTERRRINGFEFEFRLSNALKNKPNTTSAASAQDLFPGRGPRPGSDINVEGLEVKHQLGPAHFLAFNGFSTYRPHFLLMTADGYQRQWQPLGMEDFLAIKAFYDSVGGDGGDYMVFYNCRAEAGCSRVHKHLQAIPKHSFDGNPWLNLDDNADAVPFAYHADYTCGVDPTSCLEAYEAGIATLERTLGRETELENGVPPHNMLMDRGRLVVIPRRADGIGGLGANSGGMLGMIWTQSAEMMQKWLDVDPHKLLGAAGVPKLL